jgi:hypothetical protein
MTSVRLTYAAGLTPPFLHCARYWIATDFSLIKMGARKDALTRVGR